MRPKAPRVSEKATQAHIVQAMRSIGAKAYVLGHPPRRDAVFKGTGQTPGLPDTVFHVPQSPTGVPAHELWVEVKAVGGRLSETQKGFRDFCLLAGIPHLVGGLDVVLAYLQQHGYIREAAALYRRPA